MPDNEHRHGASSLAEPATSIPIVVEEARVIKHATEIERVTVRTGLETEDVMLHEHVNRENVEITRVPFDREVKDVPQVRTEGDLTIIPVLEERLVVEKRLFLVEELHMRRHTRVVPVEIATTVRRTRVDIQHDKLNEQEDN